MLTWSCSLCVWSCFYGLSAGIQCTCYVLCHFCLVFVNISSVVRLVLNISSFLSANYSFSWLKLIFIFLPGHFFNTKLDYSFQNSSIRSYVKIWTTAYSHLHILTFLSCPTCEINLRNARNVSFLLMCWGKARILSSCRGLHLPLDGDLWW